MTSPPRRMQLRRARLCSRRVSRRLEWLEPRVCPSAFYDFHVVAETGETLSQIQDLVSVNDAHQVAFVASDTAALSGVYSGDEFAYRSVSFEPNERRGYGRAASINDALTTSHQIVTSDRYTWTDGTPDFSLRRWSWVPDPQHATEVAGTPLPPIIIPPAPPIPNPFSDPEYFDSFLSFSDINAHNDVVFVGIDNRFEPNLHKLRVRESLASAKVNQYIEIGDFPITTGLRPQISDTAEVVFRSPSQASILKTDSRSGKFRRLAGAQEGFVTAGDLPAVGRSPGISDDGRIVVFFGNHPNDLVLGDGLGGGPGVFASLLLPNQEPQGGSAARMLIRLAGRPGELGLDAQGNGIQITDFAVFSSVVQNSSIDSRVGIGGPLLSRVPGQTTEHYVTFLANDPRDGKETLWQVRFEATSTGDQYSALVKSPQIVAKVGETIQGRTIEDLEIYDPITTTGDIAFWAKLSDSRQAIFLATTSPDTDRDGLLDFWEERGIDIDEDGAVDLDLPALGANPLERDLFVEIDWLRDQALISGALDAFEESLADIHLHVDDRFSRLIGQGDSETERTDVIYMGLPGLVIPADLDLTARSLQEVKDQNFGGMGALREARQYVYRYAVLANFAATLDGAGVEPQSDQTFKKRDLHVFSVTATSANSLSVADDPFTDGALRGHTVKIVAGKGAGQFRTIRGNTANTLILDQGWSYQPDDSSRFVLLASNSGQAELGGNDFLLSLRSFPSDDFYQSQTLLHEIGHNFGFIGDIVNAEHHSVMSYAYQFGSDVPPPVADFSYASYLVRSDPQDRHSATIKTDSSEWERIRLDFTSFGRTFNNAYGAVGFGSQGDGGNVDEVSYAEVRELVHSEDFELPFFQIVAPAPSTTQPIGSQLAVEVDATDNMGVSSIEFAFDLNGDGDRRDPGEVVQGVAIASDRYQSVFDPLTGPSGIRQLFVFVRDVTGNVNQGAESIQVTGGGTNAPPSAKSDSTIVVPGGTVSIAVLDNDSDLNGDPVTLLTANAALHGSVVANPDGTVTYSAPGSYLGDDRFTYVLSDGHGGTDAGTVTVLVREHNSPPVLAPIGLRSGVAGSLVSFTATASDGDAAQTLQFSLAAESPGGAAIDPVTGVFSWTPAADLSAGTYWVTVQVTDSGSPTLTAAEAVPIVLQKSGPRIAAIEPADGSELTSLRTITIDFSHPMNLAAVTRAANYRIAIDGQPPVAIASVTYADQGDTHRATITLAPDVPLTAGGVTVIVDSQALRTTGGLPLGTVQDDLIVSVLEKHAVVTIGQSADGSLGTLNRTEVPSYDQPSFVATADFNGDGLADIVTTSVATRELVLFYGLEQGGFDSPSALTLSNNAIPLRAYASDWNGDGVVDLIVGTRSAETDNWGSSLYRHFYVLVNNGHGTFANAPDTPILVESLSDPTVATFGDFTGDGLIDIAHGWASSPYYNPQDQAVVQIEAKDRFLGYGLHTALTNGRDGENIVGILTGDFNEDGRLDVLTNDTGYYLNRPSGTLYLSTPTGFADPRRIVMQVEGDEGAIPWPITSLTGDFNRDGHLDILGFSDVYSNSEGLNIGNVLVVLEGNGQGQFTQRPYQALGRRDLSLKAAADMNQDGIGDVVLTSGANIWVLLGTGRGGFTPTTSAPLPLPPHGVGNLTTMDVGDFNGDGFPDAAISSDSDFLRVAYNDRSGILYGGDAPLFMGTLWERRFDAAVQYTDLNRDGRTDLVTLGDGSPAPLLVHLGTATGDFGAASVVSIPGGASGWTLFGDLNEDGTPDLIASAESNKVVVVLGRAEGGFATPGNPIEAVGHEYINNRDPGTLVDVNADGHLDLVVTVARLMGYYVIPNGVVIYFGDGTGQLFYNRNTFVAFPEGFFYNIAAATPRPAIGPGIGDFDFDGKVDLMLSSYDALGRIKVIVYHGGGDGRFVPATETEQTINSLPMTFHAHDYDGDGRLDLLTVPVVLYRGDGAGHYEGVPGATQPVLDYLADSYIVSHFDSGDFNGDGAFDIAITGYRDAYNFDPSVVVFLNDGVGGFANRINIPVDGLPLNMYRQPRSQWTNAATYLLMPQLWPVHLTSSDELQENQQFLTGTAAPGALIRVREGGTTVADTSVGDNGQWSVSVVPRLSLGYHSLQFSAQDTAGQFSGVTEQTVLVVQNSFPWWNGRNPLDVNDDDHVSPLDALLIINYLNSVGSGPVPSPAPSAPPFFDSSRDNFVSPLDALLVINDLNKADGEGEGQSPKTDAIEAASSSTAAVETFVTGTLDTNAKRPSRGTTVGRHEQSSASHAADVGQLIGSYEPLDLLFAQLDGLQTTLTPEPILIRRGIRVGDLQAFLQSMFAGDVDKGRLAEMGHSRTQTARPNGSGGLGR
ncbi:MAG: FG-GAP-like repeat-containing protein [Pirellulaceae bacterium]